MWSRWIWDARLLPRWFWDARLSTRWIWDAGFINKINLSCMTCYRDEFEMQDLLTRWIWYVRFVMRMILRYKIYDWDDLKYSVPWTGWLWDMRLKYNLLTWNFASVTLRKSKFEYNVFTIYIMIWKCKILEFS